MDIQRRIVLTVRDRTRAVLARLQRVQDRLQRTLRSYPQLVNSMNRAVQLATRTAQGLRRVWSAIGQGISSAITRLRRFAGVAGRVAGITGGISLGGAVAGVTRLSANISRDNALATSLGTDINTFRFLRDFLRRASGGTLDESAAESLLKDLVERQGEVRVEIARAVAEGRQPNEASGAAIDAFRSLGILDTQNLALPQLLERLLEAFRNNQNAVFLGREILSEEGTFVRGIAQLSAERVAELTREIENSLVTIRPEDVDNAREFGNQLQRLRNVFERFGVKVLTPLIPVVTKFGDALAAQLERISANDIVDRFTTVADSIVTIAVSLENLINRLGGTNQQVLGINDAGGQTQGGQFTNQATRITQRIRQLEADLAARNEILNGTGLIASIQRRLVGEADLIAETLALTEEIRNLRQQRENLSTSPVNETAELNLQERIARAAERTAQLLAETAPGATRGVVTDIEFNTNEVVP